MNTLQIDLKLLNEIAKYKVESDWDSESINYIAVDYAATKKLIKKFLESNKNYTFDDYLKDYLEDGTIDICGLWGELDQAYKIDTWYNMKNNQFYIPKWYHRVNAYYFQRKRIIKYKFKILKQKVYYYKLNKKHDRQLKKRLKLLSKIYGGSSHGQVKH